MKTYPLTFLIIATAALVTFASGESKRNAAESTLATRFFQEVNAYRAKHGSGKLQRHPDMDRLAKQHCEYLRKNRGTFSVHGKNVSHFGSETRAFTAIRKLGMSDYGENVAWTGSYGSDAKTAKGLVIMWQRSKGHEPVMRNAAWTHCGVGTVVDTDGTVFATQVFGTANPKASSTRHFRSAQQ